MQGGTDMTNYPLLFGFRDLIAGRGFLAGVAVDGRALLVHDEELGYWMYGVNPGGLAAGGEDVGEAKQAFRETYRTILFDIAAEATDFQEFKAGAQKFFEETSTSFLTDWEEAIQEVRAGKVIADWAVQVDSTKTRLGIQVSLLTADQLEPKFNEPDRQPALAAAGGRF
jgi:hypothetical protein